MLLTGRRYIAFVSSFVGLIGLACYAVIIQPMINPAPYKQARQYMRADVPPDKVT